MTSEHNITLMPIEDVCSFLWRVGDRYYLVYQHAASPNSYYWLMYDDDFSVYVAPLGRLSDKLLNNAAAMIAFKKTLSPQPTDYFPF